MPFRSGLNIDAVEATKLRVLTIGLIAGLLILWLAGSFWIDAWSQYQQARRIQSLTIDNASAANASILNRSYELISQEEFSRLQVELYQQAHPSLTELVSHVVAKQRIYEFENLASDIQRAVRAKNSALNLQIGTKQNLNTTLQKAIDATHLSDKQQELTDYIATYINTPKPVVQTEQLSTLSHSVARASGKLLDDKLDVNAITEDLSSLRSTLVAIDTSISQHILKTAEKVEFHGLRRLLIDSLVIVICLWIGLSSQRLLGHIHRQAYYDRRTNLPNRFKLHKIMDKSLLARDTKSDLSALSIIEITNIDQINDSYGRELGEGTLVRVGQMFSTHAGPHARVASIGDNRFAVFFQQLKEYDNADERTQNLLSSCENGLRVDGVKVHPRINAGISYSPEHSSSTHELLQKSELAMVLADKEGDKNFLRYSEQLSEKHKARIQLEIDLRAAVKENQFSLHYQPKVCTQTGEVHSVEALIRWEHPTRGMVSPFHFISVAEQCGLIDDIGAWVMNEAIRQTVVWQHNGLENLQVAVNVSAYQFLQEGFIDQIIHTVKQHGIPENALELEITESVAMADIETVITGLTQLRNAGIKIAIDDFGTDYSSLKILDDLPVDVLKIDRSFITRLDHMDSERSLVNTIVHMARSLGLKTVAEGVETESQMEKIKSIGCDYIQGYYYAKPVPADSLVETINSIAHRVTSSNRPASDKDHAA